MTNMIITFGKYKNKELSKVYEDTNYKNWLLNQSFFKEKYHDEYQYLLKYRPLSPINFDDLPCDIKSMIYGINYNAEKSAYEKELERETEQGIVRYGKKGKKKIITRNTDRSGEPLHTAFIYKVERYLNCKECGKYLAYNGGGFNNQQAYECCAGCYEKFKREARKRKRQQKELLNNFCLISDDEY